MKTSSDDLHENSHMSRTLIWTILHQDSFWNFLENPRARCVDFEAFLQYLLTPKVLWTSDTSVAINGKTSGVCEGTKVARLYAAHQMGTKDKKPKMCARAPIRDQYFKWFWRWSCNSNFPGELRWPLLLTVSLQIVLLVEFVQPPIALQGWFWRWK